MTPAKKVVFLVASILSTAPVAGAATQSLFSVVKMDGSVRQYKLLPIKHDVRHEALVQSRLMARDGIASNLPKDHQIPVQMLPPIRDQGSRGTCAYFATVGILEAHYMSADSSFGQTKLSEECLVDVRNWMAEPASNYNGDDRPDGRPDPNGDWPSLIIKTVSYNGVPVAKQYSDTLDCTYDGANENGKDVALADYEGVFSSNASPAYGKNLAFDYNQAPTLDTVKALLAANTPIEIGLTVYNEYMSGYDWRFDPKIDNDGNLAGGHAVILTGYTEKGGKTIFTFKNSWGQDWGRKGFGTIDEALLTHSWAYDPNFDMTVSVRK